MRPLPAETVHLTFEPGAFRMAMGLVSCPWEDWFELDARYPEELAERRRLLATRHAEVFAATPASAPARAEALAALAAHLPRRYPDWFAATGTGIENRLTGERWDFARAGIDPLELAGRLVQEDLCIVLPGPDGPVLGAAVLCFPTRWVLGEKIGRPLALVHGAVPFYAERLAGPVDRLMGQLRDGRLVLRQNWGITDDPALFQTTGKGRGGTNPAVSADNAGERLWLRTERQTLSRLPDSGAVLFTIRVHVYPLSRIGARPDIAAGLAASLRALPDAMARYKSLPPVREAVLSWLDRRAAAAPAAARTFPT